MCIVQDVETWKVENILPSLKVFLEQRSMHKQIMCCSSILFKFSWILHFIPQIYFFFIFPISTSATAIHPIAQTIDLGIVLDSLPLTPLYHLVYLENTPWPGEYTF